MISTGSTRRKSWRLGTVLRHLVLVVLAAIFLVPFYILIRNAFSTQLGITAAQWNWLPDNFGPDNISELFTNRNVPIARSLLNSTVVTVTQTVLTVVISAMAGYGLARMEHRLARLVLGLTVLTLMVPAAVTFVPSFVMVSSLGWISSFRGLIIPGLFSAFATFLFRQYFLGFPKELEEAAQIDGAGPWRAFWRVVVPNTYGICAAIGTITFINSWNAFLWPLLIGQDREYRTIQVALSQFMTSQGINMPQLFVGAAVSIIPVLLVFVFLQRYLVQGVEQSGID
ncbi:MAG: carbohydrate ABC transporter permease [Propionibacteriaceae bacterium]